MAKIRKTQVIFSTLFSAAIFTVTTPASAGATGSPAHAFDGCDSDAGECSEAIDRLLALDFLVEQVPLSPDHRDTLHAQFRESIRDLDADKVNSACSRMQAAITHVKEWETAGDIAPDDARAFVNELTGIRAVLACSET